MSVGDAIKLRLDNCPTAKDRLCDALCSDCPNIAKATYTLDSLKNAARNLRTAFDAGFEVICDESTVGLNEWAVSEIERLQTENERLMRCCGKDEMRTEIERLNALVTKGRTLNDLERLMEENERLRKALDEIETLAANDTCGCNKMAPIIAICQMENKA